MMLWLQAQGCHNINFVTHEHLAPQRPDDARRGMTLRSHRR
jgi:hypothetical protein